MAGVNLLLLDPDEVAADGTAVLRDQRCTHLRTVLRVTPGQRIRAGILDGPRGHAVVQHVDAAAVHVAVRCDEACAPPADVLLLAVPRPKVLLRMLEHAAALGFGRILLFRCWRVEKSHLASSAMQPDAWRRHLRQGLEQAGRTWLPRVSFFPLFRPFVQDTLPAMELPATRCCAHPSAPTPTSALALHRDTPFALALGPDGGFLPYEVEQLAAQGFLPIRLALPPLRTESALSALFAQLDLLRRRDPSGIGAAAVAGELPW